MKLSDAQIYTLRRMNSGTRYFMRGDCLKLKSNWYSIRLSRLGKEILLNLRTSGEK